MSKQPYHGRHERAGIRVVPPGTGETLEQLCQRLGDTAGTTLENSATPSSIPHWRYQERNQPRSVPWKGIALMIVVAVVVIAIGLIR